MRRALLTLLLLHGTVAAIASSEATPLPGSGWLPEAAGLETDPALHAGRLPNGFRYVIAQHPDPEGRLSLRLAVHVGANDERDDESGYAHFVEHMAFNGTRQFPGRIDEPARARDPGVAPGDCHYRRRVKRAPWRGALAGGAWLAQRSCSVSPSKVRPSGGTTTAFRSRSLRTRPAIHAS